MPHAPATDRFFGIDHYPTALVQTRANTSALPLTLRPVVPQDANLLSQLFGSLSCASRRNRFHGAFKLSAHHLRQLSSIDYRQQLALVVSTVVDGTEQLIADARYVLQPDGHHAEFALVVADRWHGQGLGTWALQALQGAATSAGLQGLQGEVLPDNQPMLGLLQGCGFAFSPNAEDTGVVRAQCLFGTPGQPGAQRNPVEQRLGLKRAIRSWLQSIRPAWPAPLPAQPR